MQVRIEKVNNGYLVTAYDRKKEGWREDDIYIASNLEEALELAKVSLT